MADWLIGIGLSVLGSSVDNIGITMQKYSHIRNSVLPDDQRIPYYKQKLWWAGFITFLLGNLVNVLSLGFAPEVLFAAVGGVSLVANAINSHCFLGERFNRRLATATILIVLASGLAVAFGAHTKEDFTLDDLEHFLDYRFIVFVCVLGVLLITIFLSIMLFEFQLTHLDVLRQVTRADSKPDLSRSRSSSLSSSRGPTQPVEPKPIPVAPPNNQSIVSSPMRVPPSSVEEATREDMLLTSAANQAPISLVVSPPAGGATHVQTPKTVVDDPPAGGDNGPERSVTSEISTPSTSKTSWTSGRFSITALLTPAAGKLRRLSALLRFPTARWIRRYLSFAYPALAGLVGSFTVLLAKSTAEITRVTLQGSDQFVGPVPYCIIAATLLCGMTQVHFINLGLRKYEQLVVISVYYVVYTSFSILGGVFYFDEFSHFSLLEVIVFPTATVATYIGVYLIASDPSSNKSAAEWATETSTHTIDGSPIGAKKSSANTRSVRHRRRRRQQKKLTGTPGQTNSADSLTPAESILPVSAEDVSDHSSSEADASDISQAGHPAPKTQKDAAVSSSSDPSQEKRRRRRRARRKARGKSQSGQRQPLLRGAAQTVSYSSVDASGGAMCMRCGSLVPGADERSMYRCQRCYFLNKREGCIIL